MSFIEDIRKQTVEARNPIKIRIDRKNKLIDLFKSRIEQAAAEGKSEAIIWRPALEEILGSDPTKIDLTNAFRFFLDENIDFDYKWRSNEFVLHIKW